MQATVTPQQRQAAKREIVRQMKQGASTHEARGRSIVPMHRTTVYRLLKRVQSEGESALVERRHGHPVKLHGDVLTFLKEYCQSRPSASSSTVQHFLPERFGLSISVSQLNRVRAAYGLSRTPAGAAGTESFARSLPSLRRTWGVLPLERSIRGA